MTTAAMTTADPDFILFVQHGWADDNRAMLALAQDLATDQTYIVAPSLSYLMTWLRIDPLVEVVEELATQTFEQYPDCPSRVIGHSMGGLIWLEALNRHPDWWERIQSLVLLASPVGGADLGRIFDPLNMGVGIAADLGKNRRPIAEPIAAAINTLVVAGDVDGGSDGTIPVESTKLDWAQFICLPGLNHPELRHHPAVVEQIHAFWQGKPVGEVLLPNPVITALRSVPGITDAHQRGFDQAKPFVSLADGSSLRVWRNSLGIYHVFVAAADGHCLYAGYVGWADNEALWQLLQSFRADVDMAQIKAMFESS